MKKSFLSALVFTFVLTLPNAFGRPVLTQKEAEIRYKQVFDVDYQVSLDLTQALYKPNETEIPFYTGSVTIEFNLKPDAQDASPNLFLDFLGQSGAKLEKIQINGTDSNYNWNTSD